MLFKRCNSRTKECNNAVRIDIRENTKFLPGHVMASDMGKRKTWTLSIARCSKKIRERNVSETRSVFLSQVRGDTPTLLGQ
jgi:hypothetical protein